MSVSFITRYRSVFITLFVLGIAHFIPLLPQVPLVVRAILAEVATLAVSGYWVIRALLGKPAATLQAKGEYALYSLGAGFGVQILAMTMLSYAPGGITPWHTLLTFDAVVLVLMAIALRTAPTAASDATYPDSHTSVPTTWIIGFAIVVLVAGFFRFAHLGYAEYQGDEARAVLRAAAILQGHEETLFLHRKGPAEIVLTAVVYSITGQLTETTARLPFALAGLAIPLVLLFIGWRVHSPFAGWCAAMLLAIDGHFIGYGRIVQYHTIADFMSVLVILIGCHLLFSPRHITRYLLLTAFFTATGLLAHYEVLQIGVPLLFVLFVLWRQGVRLTRIVGATVAAIIAGVVSVALFYVPFVLSPGFGSIADYLAENLVEGEGHFPYNHLAEIFTTSTFYSTTYFMVALVALLTVGIVALVWKRWGAVGGLFAVALLGVLFTGAWQPAWLTVNGYDLTIVVALLLGILVLSSRLNSPHRLVWVWFGVHLLVAGFAVARTSLHYIPTYMPWAILVGVVLAHAYEWLSAQVALRPVRTGLAVVGVALYAICSGFIYRTFVDNRTEFIRTWDWKPAYAWTLHNEVGEIPLFGVPHQSGWKTVGMLYEQGVLDGTYDTNTRDWVAEWYSRRALRCERTHRYFILEVAEQPWKQTEIKEELAQAYHLRGTITVNGDPRLEVYEVGPADGTAPFTVEERDFEPSFDQTSTYVGLDLDTPVIEPNPQYLNRIQVDDHLWLEGYDLDQVEATAGDYVRVTVYWRVTGEIDDDWYTVADVVADDGEIEGELEREPGCYDRPTSRWQDGTLIVDHYELPLFDDAAEGAYELLVGMYDPETGEPLSIYDDAGDFVGDMLNLAEIIVDK